MRYGLRFLHLRSREEVEREIRRLGADPAGTALMAPKGVTRPIRLAGVPCAVANLLKQELLSRGGDCAVAHGTLTHSVERTDVLLLATERQYRKLILKLKTQRFLGLPGLAHDLERALANLNRRRFPLRVAGRTLDLGERTYVMGVLNVTPDSFSDGGRWADPERAAARGREMRDRGADIIDVGGESTRPGAEPVPADEEARRVVPVVERLAGDPDAIISVDTSKAEVARRALDAGAHMINDVTGLTGDPEMARLAAERGVPVVVMHMRGTPRDMQDDPYYEDVVGEVIASLERSLELARAAGVDEEQVLVDPGIGFGKRLQDNLDLLRHLEELKVLGRPILVGTSRKSFIGAILDLPVEERLEGTAATVALGIAAGARVVRVHDVPEMVRVARMTDAIVRRP